MPFSPDQNLCTPEAEVRGSNPLWRDEPVPLWEEHYKISPIDTDGYLLSCCRYVERNPVKAGMVEAPEDYPWSSYAARIGLTHCDWLDEPPTMAELGSDASSHRERDRAFVGDGEFSHQDHLIRAAIDRNKLTGGNHFADEVERRIGLRIESRAPGRLRIHSGPRKSILANS